jgi:AraC family transcriptional regulator
MRDRTAVRDHPFVPNRSLIDLTLKRRTLVSRSVVATSGVTAEHVATNDPVDYEFSVSPDTHYLALHDLVLRAGVMRVNGEKRVRCRDLRQTLTFLPAGSAVDGWCKPIDRSQAFTALYIDPTSVPEAVRCLKSWADPQVHFKSPTLLRTTSQLSEVVQGSLPFKELLVDALTQLAIAELAALQGGPRISDGPDRKLDTKELQHIERYLVENVTQKIGLDDMAGVVGMSKFHFIRCYRAATGRTPYRSLIELRCDVALRELGGGKSPEDAATLAGFDGAPQMARTLRSARGIAVRDVTARANYS